MARHVFFGIEHVAGQRAVLSLIVACSALGACATVSVYEPGAVAEISLTASQSELHKAAKAYCETTREQGLATGEASLGQLANIFTGRVSDENAYWRRIGADRAAPATVVSRIRSDMGRSAAGLADLDKLGRDLLGRDQIAARPPTRDDVNQFELALIHARQARESLAGAIAQVNERGVTELGAAAELGPLDAALATARATADDLAAARAEAEARAGA